MSAHPWCRLISIVIMLRILCSTLSLVGWRWRSIVPATNSSQCVCGCNPGLTCSPTVTCSPKTEPKVTVICGPKTEPKVAKKFKRKSAIPFKICLSKDDNIQIHQYIAMSQDLNPSSRWSLVIFTFNATPIERLQQYPLVIAMNRTHWQFFCECCA